MEIGLGQPGADRRRGPQAVTATTASRMVVGEAARQVHHSERMRPSEALATHRAEPRRLVSRHKLTYPRIFGSVLTGTDADDSDLDPLVEPVEGTTLLTIAGLRIAAEELLGGPVSGPTPSGLPPKFRDEVLRQARPL